MSLRALSLVELLVALTIISLMSAAMAALLHTCLQVHAIGQSRSTLLHDGRIVMERMSAGVRLGADHSTPANALAFSPTIPYDDAINAHYYDSDSASGLFPRPDTGGPDTLTYTFVALDQTLTETLTAKGGDTTVVLASDVTSFSATLDPADTTHDDRLSLSLTLTAEGGETMVFTETVFPRNTTQKWGRRVK